MPGNYDMVIEGQEGPDGKVVHFKFVCEGTMTPTRLKGGLVAVSALFMVLAAVLFR